MTVSPHTTYTFSFWGAEVDDHSNSLPHLQVMINGRPVGDGTIPTNNPNTGGSWQNYTFTWNSGSSTRAVLAVYDLNTDTAWNDFALYDISFVAQ